MLRPSRIALIHGSLLLFALAILARAAEVQLWQRGLWSARAQRQHYVSSPLPAPRGGIYDETGMPLAQSRTVVRLAIAPKELADLRGVARALARLGVDHDWVARATDRRRAWVDLPGDFLPEDVAELARMRGVYAKSATERVYPAREATRRVVGRVGRDGSPVDGIELALDSFLHGKPGSATLARDPRGSAYAMLVDTALAPAPGDEVVLTINQELQEIAERALDRAMEEMGADGGDIVVLDPQSGEIRAMASRRDDPRSAGSPALSEPFEPGSTLKPLVASRLLMLHRARVDEVMNTENGRYTVAGRTIEDVHKSSQLTLADVIRFSSNIGIVKFASRLSAREEFEMLRDFGFGTATGVPFPAEASGTLRPPSRWSLQSPASLAMGYEVSVNAVQLATAYAPLANGGELLAPALVKEIRAPDGRVLYHHERRVLRRVMRPGIADTVRRMLVGVVEDGTATKAALRNYALAGKSGTSRRVVVGGHGYAAGHYTASFIGLFPAERPQYVILVKLDDPTRSIYGGSTAAPISKTVLEAAMASRDAALAHSDSDSAEKRSTLASNEQPTTTAAAGEVRELERSASDTPPAVVDLPRHHASHVASTMRAVPTVQGLPLRAAVLALHRAGFRVQLGGFGEAQGTSPAAGTLLRQGQLVRLQAAP